MIPIKESRMGEGYTLSTGRRLQANLHIVGISPRNDELTDGYDGSFYDPWRGEWDKDFKPLTKEECAEVADYMISLWQGWKARHGE